MKGAILTLIAVLALALVFLLLNNTSPGNREKQADHLPQPEKLSQTDQTLLNLEGKIKHLEQQNEGIFKTLASRFKNKEVLKRLEQQTEVILEALSKSEQLSAAGLRSYGMGKTDQECSIDQCFDRFRNSRGIFRSGIFIGDSLTHFAQDHNGFGNIIQQKLNDSDVHSQIGDVKLIYKGFSSHNTRGLLSQLRTNRSLSASELSAVENPAFVTLLMGPNDASSRGQHVPITEYGENLMKVMHHCHENMDLPYDRQIVISMPAFDSSRIKDGSRHNVNAVKYVAESRNVAATLGARFLPLYDIMRMHGEDIEGLVGWKSYLKDGLHLSDSGNKLLADELWEKHILCLLCEA